MNLKSRATLFWTAIVLLLAMNAQTRAADFVTRVKATTKSFSSPPCRMVGSKGHEDVKNALAQRITSLKGVELVRQPFHLMAPVTRRAVMKISSGDLAGEHAIHPVWPDNVRLKTTPEKGIAGKVVYVGEGRYADIPASSLRGQIAAIEMSVYKEQTWLRAFEFGASAVLLLGSDDDTHATPSYEAIYKPRYYLPDGPLANAIRKGNRPEATLYCDGAWEKVQAENLIALLPGTDPSLPPVLIACSYDAMSIVPTLAPGADTAVDAAFLIEMLSHLSEHPPRRGVLVTFVDAFGFNMLGTRELMAMLSLTKDDLTRTTYEEHFEGKVQEYEDLLQQVELLGSDAQKALPQLADKAKYQELQRYVKDVLSPEILALREEVFGLRLEEEKVKGEEKKKIEDLQAEKLAEQAKLDSILSGVIKRGKLPEGTEKKCAQVWNAIEQRCRSQLAELKEETGIFLEYDSIRAKVYAGMGLKTGTRMPIPFVLGIDISDCSTNMGPSLYDEALFTSYKNQAKGFLSWFKEKIRSPEKAVTCIPEVNLGSLGLSTGGVDKLVDEIVNTESIVAGSLEETLRKSIPGLTDDSLARILGGIRLAREGKDKNLHGAVATLLEKELPDMSQGQAAQLIASILNEESLSGGVDHTSVSVQRMALLTGVCASFQFSGVTWSSLEGIRRRLDTPQDRFDRLDWNRLAPQLNMTALLVELLLNDTSFKPAPFLARPGTYPRWRLPEGLLVSESVAETISRTPEKGMLATSFNPRPDLPPVAMRGHEFVVSGSDGRFSFRPAPCYTNWPPRRRPLKAFGLAPDGRIVKSIAKIKSMLTVGSESLFALIANPPLAPLRGEIFECVEVNGPVLRDPRYQQELSGGRVLDVSRGGVPKKHYWRSSAGPMFGLLQPKTHYQVIMALGGHNRLALLNIPENLNTSSMNLREALEAGYEATKPLPALPELISAKDFFQIDTWRLNRLVQAGVVCKAISDIHDKTEVWLQKAEASYKADDGAGHKRAATAALANEIRAYQAVQDQANDVTRGAIFLLLLLVPFSIAMERLIFASPDITKQISRSIIIFVVMFLALTSFHPGFKITTMPAVILIAFMVLLLSVSVINMVFSKFRADMEELRRGTLAEASGAQTGRGGVVMSAIWLGIANMRKRIVRTLLTGLTIVLVTFALLCFTSTSTYEDKRVTALRDIQKTHDGVLLQHPSSRALEQETLESISNLVGGETKVVGRYWAVNSSTPTWRIHVRNGKTNQLAPLKAGLGLEPGEAAFCHTDTILPDWDEFSRGDGCYVSEVVAQRLGVEAGGTVMVAGTPLRLIGTFDAGTYEAAMTKLNGQPLLPIDYTVQKVDGVFGDAASMEGVMAGGSVPEPDPTMVYVSANEIIVLPVDIARDLGGELRSLALKAKDGTSEGLARKLVETLVYPVYFGAKGGVKVIVSTPLLPKAPRKLFIPILIAALIIFNTMLNSIAERKKEIFVYSSLGLAPQHIGVLFLAEAMTYGLMGSVFGYIIGQGAAKVLTGLDLMGGITLNYSGSNVIMTMGLVMLVVVLSSIVPAIMAAKVASPSGDLDWKVPQPVDGIIRGQLPFAVSQQAAPGLAAFLYEYLDAHSDGAIGNFSADNLALEQGEGDTVISLQATIWPAPYDLGVRQDIVIDFDVAEGDICDLHIQLKHRAGQVRSWWRLNRVFLGTVRAQLLGWRNIAPERMLKYIRSSENMPQKNSNTAVTG